jgi:soluble lytic murein transglycosylase-like protein
MPGPFPFLRVARGHALKGLSALLLALASLAQAQVCGAAPKIGAAASGAEPTERFRMITSQCGALATPMKVHRAAQLDLYDKPGGVAITLPADPAASTPPPAAASAPRSENKPLPRGGERVLTLAPALTDAAREHQIDPLLLHAIAHVESRHNADAKSKAGARGVMQVMPATGKRFGVHDERQLFDAHTNARASAAYLRTLRGRYGDDLRLMLAAYNAGEGAVDKYGRDVPPYPETQAYVRDVTAIYRRLSATFAVSPSGALTERGSH